MSDKQQELAKLTAYYLAPVKHHCHHNCNKLLPELINKWKQYYELNWGEPYVHD